MSTYGSPGLEKPEQSEAGVITSNYLGKCFAGLAELRALHQGLLENLGVKCFVESYQTALETYVLELEAHTALEKEIVRILANCNNRSSIASEIVANVVVQEGEKIRIQSDGSAAQPPTNQSAESLSRDIQGLPNPAIVPAKFPDEESEYDDLREDSQKTLAPFNISETWKFLKQRTALQALVLQLRLLTLPHDLKDIMETTPRNYIGLSNKNDTSLLNRYKISVETHTAYLWDWWPLQKSVPLLGPGKSRLQWKVSAASAIVQSHANGPKFIGDTMYEVVSIQEAETIAQILATMKEHPSRCYCCKP